MSARPKFNSKYKKERQKNCSIIWLNELLKDRRKTNMWQKGETNRKEEKKNENVSKEELNWVFGFASTVSSKEGASLGENTKLYETPSIFYISLEFKLSVCLTKVHVNWVDDIIFFFWKKRMADKWTGSSKKEVIGCLITTTART